MNFLKVSRYAFGVFALFGLMDNISTMILIHLHGIEVETNPLIKIAFSQLNFYCFIPHLLLVVFAAYQLSKPAWNNPKRFMVKSALFYAYVFVIVNNWYQVAQIGIQILTTKQIDIN